MGTFLSHLCALPVLIGSLMFSGIPRRASLLQHASEVWRVGVGCDYGIPLIEGKQNHQCIFSAMPEICVK